MIYNEITLNPFTVITLGYISGLFENSNFHAAHNILENNFNGIHSNHKMCRSLDLYILFPVVYSYALLTRSMSSSCVVATTLFCIHFVEFCISLHSTILLCTIHCATHFLLKCISSWTKMSQTVNLGLPVPDHTNCTLNSGRMLLYQVYSVLCLYTQTKGVLSTFFV